MLKIKVYVKVAYIFRPEYSIVMVKVCQRDCDILEQCAMISTIEAIWSKIQVFTFVYPC